MSLSEYEIGKIYAFPLKLNEYTRFPTIENDTKYPVISVITGYSTDDLDDTFFEELYTNQNFDSYGGSIAGDSDKIYLKITESSVDYLFENEDTFNLSESIIGEEIDFIFEDYIYNDTEKTYTLSCENKEYVVAPDEVVKCSWMNDVMVLKAE